MKRGKAPWDVIFHVMFRLFTFTRYFGALDGFIANCVSKLVETIAYVYWRELWSFSLLILVKLNCLSMPCRYIHTFIGVTKLLVLAYQLVSG